MRENMDLVKALNELKAVKKFRIDTLKKLNEVKQ